MAAASDSEAAPLLLVNLKRNALHAVVGALADPLTPHAAVALASTGRGLRAPTEVALAGLRRRREAAEALCRKARTSCAAVREATVLTWHDNGIAVADCDALADLIFASRLLHLGRLFLEYNRISAAGMQALAEALGSGALPSLTLLSLGGNTIGDVGAAALAAALSRCALPRLERLFLGGNRLGDAGLLALAAPLRQRAALIGLGLGANDIGDDGVATLVAADAGAWQSLNELWLAENHIGDAGCAALACALDNGVLPALEMVDVEDNPASGAAQAALRAVAPSANEDLVVNMLHNSSCEDWQMRLASTGGRPF